MLGHLRRDKQPRLLSFCTMATFKRFLSSLISIAALQVEALPLQFLAGTDKRLQRLRPFMRSPMAWFRAPYVHVILVHTADVTEYRCLQWQ